MLLAGVGVAAEVVVVVRALEVLVHEDHLVDLGPHVGLEDRGGDLRVAGHADRLADVVAEARDDHLVVGAVALGARGGLQAVGELVGGEAVGDVARASAACPSTRSATRAWFCAVSAPMTAHCSAVDSSMLRKLVTVLMAHRLRREPVVSRLGAGSG